MPITSEIIPLDDLVPDDRNPKRHDDENVQRLVSRILAVGFTSPVLVDQETRTLKAGHRRRLALRLIREQGQPEPEGIEPGWGVPARVGTWTELQALQVLVGDNEDPAEIAFDQDELTKLLAELNEQNALEGAGYSDDRLEELLAELREQNAQPVSGGILPHSDPDLIPESAPARCQPGDLWKLGAHRLLCGDSTNAEAVARLLGGERPDCVFTSPPYAVGVDYGEYEDTIANLRGMLPTLSNLWMEHLAEGGFAVLNFGDIASGRNIANSDTPCEYPMALEYWPVFRSGGWVLWSRRVWVKPNARVNSMWCIQSNRAAADWEHIWTWKKPGAPVVGRVLGDHASCNGWFDSSCSEAVQVGKDTHGAGMPAVVAKRMIGVHSLPGHIVWEPFTGTGTTLVSAEAMGRRCYGMELSPRYVDITLARWERATGQTAELLERVS